MSQNNLDWKDVPTEYYEQWAKVFDESQEGFNLSTPCPVCNKVKLHCYYDLNRIGEIITIDSRKYIGRGGLWQWCSNCRSYCHYSAAIPEWWIYFLNKNFLNIDRSKLFHNPEAIEDAMDKNLE